MATAREHYAAAEAHLVGAGEGRTEDERTLVAYAQVHATLALAAVTSLEQMRVPLGETYDEMD
jgi:hypothetical protein